MSNKLYMETPVSVQPKLRMRDVFPFRSIAPELFLVLLVGGFAIFVNESFSESGQRIVGGVIIPLLLITWVYWLQRDIQKLRDAIRLHGPFDPENAPRLYLPFRFLFDPLFVAACCVGPLLGNSMDPFGAILFALYGLTLFSGICLFSYLVLPPDSVEAREMLLSTGFAFIATVSILFALSFVSGLVSDQTLLNTGEDLALMRRILRFAPLALLLFMAGAQQVALVFLRSRR